MATKKEPKQRQIASAGKDGWPVYLAMCASAIRKQDEYVFKRSPRFVDIIAKATSVRVEKNGQTQTLDAMCERGCSRDELLYLLGMCENRGVTNALKMTGFDSDKLPQRLREIEKCAAVIRQLNGHAVAEGWGGTEFGKVLEMARVKRGMIASFLQLPACLDEYASLVKHASKYLGGKSDFYLSLAKAALVNFVRERTKDDHPKDVANLLSVMLGEEYGEVEHRVWQGTYHDRFTHYRPDPNDSPRLRAMKTLLECEAVVLYRMDILHPGKKYLRQVRKTVQRLTTSTQAYPWRQTTRRVLRRRC